MTPLHGALQMAALGFSVFPLKPGTKDGHLSKSWKAAATNDPARINQIARQHPNCNWGVRCAGFLVLDVDVADGKSGEASLLRLELKHELPATRTHHSARGGQHVFYRLPAGTEVTNRDAPLGEGMNVRGAGGYVVCPGSTFEGRPYGVIDATAIADAPASLVALLKAPVAVRGAAIPEEHQDNPADVAKAASWLDRRPPVQAGARGSHIYKAAAQLRDWGLTRETAQELIADHYGERMEPPADFDFCEHETASAYKNAQNTAGSKSVAADFDDVSAIFTELETATTASGEEVPADNACPASLGERMVWPVAKIDPEEIDPRTGKLKVRVSVKAIDNIAAHLEWSGTSFWYDLFTETPRVMSKHFGFDGEMSDTALERVRLDAFKRGLDCPKDHYYAVILDLAKQQSRHPVREYLDALKWDGVPRLSKLFTRYLRADDTPLNRAIAELVLVAAVRRVRKPGEKFDYLPVIESPEQGQGKSTLVRVLGGEQWSGMGLSLHLEERELLERTSSKWIIEIDELAGLNTPKGLAHVKSLITRQEGRARAAYDRFARTVLRQWIAIATTNETRYLTDPTGNRRFLPVRVGQASRAQVIADIDALQKDRDQLWAEAAQRERTYGMLVLPADVLPALVEAQQAREVIDPVRAALEPLYGSCVSGYVLCADVWRALGYDAGKGPRGYESRRVAEVMEQMGFEHKRMRVDTNQLPYVYAKTVAGSNVPPDRFDPTAPNAPTRPVLVVDNLSAAQRELLA